MKPNPLFTHTKKFLLLAVAGSAVAFSGCAEREEHHHHDGRHDHRRGYDGRVEEGVTVRRTGYSDNRGYDDGYGRSSSTVVVTPGATVRRERVTTY